MTARTNRTLFHGLLTLVMVAAAASLPASPIVVTTAAELEAALTPANAGKQIRVQAGEYEVSHALIVPDDATLVGEGQMSFDGAGLPTGFEPSGRTVIRSTAALVGDVLTLGDGATLRGLVIEDALGRTSGNPLVVGSRAAGDFVSAQIAECEIVNPNPSGIVPAGPTGRGLVVITRNPNLAEHLPPHDGAVVRVEMRRSIVRSTGGGIGVFAINFASHAAIDLVLRRNVIGGGLNASGGVSRPDAVTGSSMNIESHRNLFWNESLAVGAFGWSLLGGATPPIPLVAGATTQNRLRVGSHEDQIRGFGVGISGVGGQRVFAAAGPVSANRLDVDIHDLSLQTTAEPGAADLMLYGARSLTAGLTPGDGNTLHANVRKSTGSGPRANQYANSGIDSGLDNRLEIEGKEKQFLKSNDDFEPIPPAEFFTDKQ